MTSTGMLTRANETGRGSRATGLWLLVGLTVSLTVVGVAIAALLLARGGHAGSGPAGGVMGQPVETSFGAFTVTNATATFVPDTQGPPTRAQHNGTNGTYQLQVSIRLVNERAEQGLAFGLAQLRLVTAARAGKAQDPGGSSIEATRLPRGGTIDGRVWFDLPKGSKATGVGWWLEFKDPGGDAVRVALDPPKVAPTPAATREVPDQKQHPADKH